MSTSRALMPIFGSSCRIFDQLVPQLASQSTRKFISSRPSIPICPSCRHSYSPILSRRQLQFSSSSSSSSNSTPPKPPNNNDAQSNSPAGHHNPTPPFPPPPFPETPQSEPSKPPTPQQQQHQQSAPPPPEYEPEPEPEPQKPADPNLPSTQNSRRSSLNRQLSAFMDRAQTTLFAASQRINDLTGYSGIETLKSQISTLEADLASAQASLHAARGAYKHAVAERASTQREVTALLARQKTWSPADFERFTALYRQDYELEAAVASRASELEEAEHTVERLGRELSAGILSRYHEEQIWSDKIRRMSTWGTWGLMSVNVLLFLVFQFGAEPWRRKRLVKGFEEKVREALEEERRLDEKEREVERERRRVEELNAAATAAAEAPVAIKVAEPEPKPTEAELTHDLITIEKPWPPRINISWQDIRETLFDPNWWKALFIDLSSDRRIAIRMRDVSLIALEGAAAGAAIVSTILSAVLFIRRV
ncbi:Mdm33 family-domain-containing protein [Hypoxylon trugodes]|uniref:Mdm33 family-domain-containing protein n=1 Tax=Hypoxylon trugodes TaxID=326681 RepID=UPI00219E5EC9|nr:Mdm33 family-domain-containing protein [Hypoxylon trugodes]KAI1386235.1 Mdm33 family-domain-containing protein [Hypoxylon trugodes]